MKELPVPEPQLYEQLSDSIYVGHIEQLGFYIAKVTFIGADTHTYEFLDTSGIWCDNCINGWFESYATAKEIFAKTLLRAASLECSASYEEDAHWAQREE
jgi:hypothetical protein